MTTASQARPPSRTGWKTENLAPNPSAGGRRVSETRKTATASGPSAPTSTRRIAANAAALGPTDMNAVAGVGAPSYASGVHWWNGTTAALKPRPTVTRARATMVGPLATPFATRYDAIATKSVARVTP